MATAATAAGWAGPTSAGARRRPRRRPARIGGANIFCSTTPRQRDSSRDCAPTGSVAWRCHVGRDTPNEYTDAAWAFLQPHIADADAYVFTRRQYAPERLDDGRLVVIPPSVDPFSAKNRDCDPPTVTAVLATVGLVSGADTDGPVRFERRDG